MHTEHISHIGGYDEHDEYEADEENLSFSQIPLFDSAPHAESAEVGNRPPPCGFDAGMPLGRLGWRLAESERESDMERQNCARNA